MITLWTESATRRERVIVMVDIFRTKRVRMYGVPITLRDRLIKIMKNATEIKVIYDKAKAMRADGLDVQVDHIVPINSNIICGLHVPCNLQIIGRLPNIFKSNHMWPNHPFENEELF